MNIEDELAKELAEAVPNTYGDLHDGHVEYIEENGKAVTISQDTVVASYFN